MSGQPQIPEHFRFTWRGREFRWASTAKCFICELETNCRANVHPIGTWWEAEIIIKGGVVSDTGRTPIEALDAAHRAWLFKVECVGDERKP